MNKSTQNVIAFTAAYVVSFVAVQLTIRHLARKALNERPMLDVVIVETDGDTPADYFNEKFVK